MLEAIISLLVYSLTMEISYWGNFSVFFSFQRLNTAVCLDIPKVLEGVEYTFDPII